MPPQPKQRDHRAGRAATQHYHPDEAQHRDHPTCEQIDAMPPHPIQQPSRTIDAPLNDHNLAGGPPVHSRQCGSTDDDLKIAVSSLT
jgi:hypothetical protein